MLYGESKISPLGDFIILPNAVDITVVEVTNASYFLDFGFEFLPLDQWGINHPLRPREDAPNYLVLGYPHTKTRKEVFGRKSDSVPFGFWTRLYGSEELQILGCDELTELALRFIPTKLYDERLALHHRAPDLQGMSGCGIWDTAGLEPILVGVLLEQRPVTTPLSLIATRIDAISEVLRGIGDTSIPMSRRLAVDVDFRQITVL